MRRKSCWAVLLKQWLCLILHERASLQVAHEPYSQTRPLALVDSTSFCGTCRGIHHRLWAQGGFMTRQCSRATCESTRIWDGEVGRRVHCMWCQSEGNTIDTEIIAKRSNMISELITFRITKAKAKVKFGVKYLCGDKCTRSSVQ